MKRTGGVALLAMVATVAAAFEPATARAQGGPAAASPAPADGEALPRPAAASTPASASEGAREVDGAPPPRAASVVYPVLGLATLGGGMAMSLHVARRERDSDPACARYGSACPWLAIGGLTLAQVGGALATYWTWTLGESHADRDWASGAVSDKSAQRLAGLLIGGAGLAAMYGGSLYAALAGFSCLDPMGTLIDDACVSRHSFWGTAVTLAAEPVIVAGAMLGGYGFGYRAASRRRRGGVPSAMLAPLHVSGGGGLSLVGRF